MVKITFIFDKEATKINCNGVSRTPGRCRSLHLNVHTNNANAYASGMLIGPTLGGAVHSGAQGLRGGGRIMTGFYGMLKTY